MSEAGGLLSTDFRLGFYKPIDNAWRPVVYSAVPINGTLYAVVDACILIGTADEQAETATQIRANNNAALFTDPGFVLMGGGIKGASYRWPNAQVPYEIADVPNAARITDAIAHWEAKTKIRFVPKANEHLDWTRFERTDSGCSSYVGRRGGMQQIFVGDACSKGNMIHEIGHCTGLYHEQSRSDRDSFVEIKWGNVKASAKFNFNREDSINLGAYDFGSVMHYSPKSFSINGEDTILPRTTVPSGVVMGQRDGLSAGDIAAIGALYP